MYTHSHPCYSRSNEIKRIFEVSNLPISLEHLEIPHGYLQNARGSQLDSTSTRGITRLMPGILYNPERIVTLRDNGT